METLWLDKKATTTQNTNIPYKQLHKAPGPETTKKARETKINRNKKQKKGKKTTEEEQTKIPKITKTKNNSQGVLVKNPYFLKSLECLSFLFLFCCCVWFCLLACLFVCLFVWIFWLWGCECVRVFFPNFQQSFSFRFTSCSYLAEVRVLQNQVCFFPERTHVLV